MGMNGGGGIGRMMKEPHQKPQNGMATFKRLTQYYWEHRLSVAILVACALIDVVATLFTPWLMGKALDTCFHVSVGERVFNVDFGKLFYFILGLGALYAVSAASAWWREFGQRRLSLSISRQLRNDLMKKLLSYPASFFDTHSRGELMSRFTNDVELVNRGIGETLLQMISAIITMTGMIVMMTVMSWKLMLCMLCTIPLVILISRSVMGRSRAYFVAQQKAVGQMNGIIEESLNGLSVSRSFLREDVQEAKFEEANQQLKTVGIKAQIISGIIMPILRILDNASYIVIAVIGGLFAASGSITIGVVQTFLLYSKQFLRPVNMLAMQLNQVQSAIAGAERIFQLMDQASEPAEEEELKEELNNPVAEKSSANNRIGKIEFKHVFFSYVEGVEVLRDLSFVVEPNQFVALVGQTGEGKSTIVNLLLRFYEPQSGQILIDDVDISTMSLATLRHKVGLVLQDAILFSDTISYNIKYGKPNASQEEMMEAAKLSNADQVVDMLPEKYDTMLNNQGVNVSQGERQLLTIARAVLPKAPILIFDEATSNIDVATEKLVQGAVDNLRHKSTSFVIAHRLSTIQAADNILVLSGGKIAEQGTHETLMATEGSIYGEIFRSQF